jgi:hypothetical protein
MRAEMPRNDSVVSLPFEGRTLTIQVAEIDPRIRACGLPFEIDPVQVWVLPATVRSFDVAQLTWMLDLPFWPKDGRLFQVSPQEVLANASASPLHHARIMAADLTFPVDVVSYRGRWLLLDGLHRLSRAVSLSLAQILARRHRLSAVREQAAIPPVNHPDARSSRDHHDPRI